MKSLANCGNIKMGSGGKNVNFKSPASIFKKVTFKKVNFNKI